MFLTYCLVTFNPWLQFIQPTKLDVTLFVVIASWKLLVCVKWYWPLSITDLQLAVFWGCLSFNHASHWIHTLALKLHNMTYFLYSSFAIMVCVCCFSEKHLCFDVMPRDCNQHFLAIIFLVFTYGFMLSLSIYKYLILAFIVSHFVIFIKIWTSKLL